MGKLIFIFLILFCSSKCFAVADTCSIHNKNVLYTSSIKCISDFKKLSGNPLSNKFGNTDAVKVILNLHDDNIYFINGNIYKFHYDFCKNVLQDLNDLSHFNDIEYSNTNERNYILANINHYVQSNTWVLEFFVQDLIADSLIQKMYSKIVNHTFINSNLKLYVNSYNMSQRSIIAHLPTISSNDIYEHQRFFSFTKGTTFGYLKLIPDSIFHQQIINEKDIVVLQSLPQDLSTVSGVITTQIQTPLSHVTLLCANRQTPNCTYTEAFKNLKILKLNGKLVKMQITEDTIIIKEAKIEEAALYFEKHFSKKKLEISLDAKFQEILSITQFSIKDVDKIGGKAANMAELHKISLGANHQKIPLPEAAYAIPFYYYLQHLQKNNIQIKIDQMLADSVLQSNQILLQERLKTIQQDILAAPLDIDFVKKITALLVKEPYQNFRFRSSTNAEDISGFNGAGLYVSKTGSLFSKNKSIEKAIKQVWASVWDFKAYQEREYFHINQSKIAMAVLIHRAFGTELANGVALTQNPYRLEQFAFLVNAQIGENSVVFPADTVSCDQFLINMSWDNNDSIPIIEYITKSNLTAPNTTVLSVSQINELKEYLLAIHNHYYDKQRIYYMRNANKFAMDVEFKVDAFTNKLYIKQARIFWGF